MEAENIAFIRLDPGSPHLRDLAMLHIRALSDTLTSRRGVDTLVGIYQHLLARGHAIYVALHNSRPVGGLVVIEHDKASATLGAALHRPWSWITALRRSGPSDFFGQVEDLLAVRRASKHLPTHNYIIALYVSDDLRRSGVAASLVQMAKEEALRGGSILGVDTLQSNQPARSFYRSQGFVEGRHTRRSVVATYARG